MVRISRRRIRMMKMITTMKMTMRRMMKITMMMAVGAAVVSL